MSTKNPLRQNRSDGQRSDRDGTGAKTTYTIALTDRVSIETESATVAQLKSQAGSRVTAVTEGDA